MQVWMRARRTFPFKGTTYQSGQVFDVEPIVAVQMRAMGAAVFAKAPSEKSPIDDAHAFKSDAALTAMQSRRKGRRTTAPVLNTPEPILYEKVTEHAPVTPVYTFDEGPTVTVNPESAATDQPRPTDDAGD